MGHPVPLNMPPLRLATPMYLQWAGPALVNLSETTHVFVGPWALLTLITFPEPMTGGGSAVS